MKLEILDTTLRDGEQTTGVAFTESEKLNIASVLLRDLKVDRIEVASARVSEGERRAVEGIVRWAEENGCAERVEILGFVDGGRSLDWIADAGGRTMNLLCKGSRKHVEGQLRKQPAEHLKDVRNIVELAAARGMAVNVYLEDWSNGMLDSPDYVKFFVESLKDTPVRRLMLPDTLGVLTPVQTGDFCRRMVADHPWARFDFHAHNDYELAVANSLAAFEAGCHGLHATVNGLGERAGNTTLSSLVVALRDHYPVEMQVNESRLTQVSRLVEAFSGVRVAPTKPIIGEHVFTQCCGVHADGDQKGRLYYNRLLPERFGRLRKYALGKTSGKASIKKNLEELGIHLEPEAMQKVTQRVIELGDKKEKITTADLPYIISDVLGSEFAKDKIRLANYYVCHACGLRPVAMLKLEVEGALYEAFASGNGQYDAFMRALSDIYRKLGRTVPTLLDFEVTIPPGGRTDAFVETVITWRDGEREFKTRGLDSDQMTAAIQATLKMLNCVGGEV